MIQIRAKFDGQQVVLPPDFRAFSAGEVMVLFPEELVAVSGGKSPATIWEILNDGYQAKRTLEDALDELHEGRDAWSEPRDESKGDR